MTQADTAKNEMLGRAIAARAEAAAARYAADRKNHTAEDRWRARCEIRSAILRDLTSRHEKDAPPEGGERPQTDEQSNEPKK